MRVYFMGVCGTAMGQAALLLRDLGHEVLGSDQGTYPPMSDLLAAAGIDILPGYDASRLARLAPDLVVIGNAHGRGNPEIEWLLEERTLRTTSLPALLHDFVLRDRRPLVIAGTHGKTTTTAIAAQLLRAAGACPGWLLGGAPRQPPTGAAPGIPGGPFVIEGDEYDSAFFDKRAKFVHYAPRVLALNNIEFDHADIYRDGTDYRRAFSHVARLVPSGGTIVANADDAEVAAVTAAVTWCPIVRCGLARDADVRISDFDEGPSGTRFTLHWRGTLWASVSWPLPGLFNARNAAMAATAAGLLLDPATPTHLDLSPLATFEGVRRRQDIRLEAPRTVIIEDFGHHPTALRETLASLRRRWPGHALWAAFEPRSNSARSPVFADAFASALATADRAFIGAVARADRLRPADRLDTAALATAIRNHGTPAEAYPDHPSLLESLLQSAPTSPSPLTIVFFTNGDFGGILPPCITALRPPPLPPPEPPKAPPQPTPSLPKGDH